MRDPRVDQILKEYPGFDRLMAETVLKLHDQNKLKQFTDALAREDEDVDWTPDPGGVPNSEPGCITISDPAPAITCVPDNQENSSNVISSTCVETSLS